MNQGLIPQRYAKALYKVALERQCTEPLYTMMKTLDESFMTQPQLGHVMENPFVSATEKKSLLLTAAGIDPKQSTGDDSTTGTLIDFIRLLEENRRIGFIRGIALAYIAIYRREHEIATVTVTSAAPLQPDATERLMSLIKSRHPQGSIEYREVVDPSLIGGFTVAIDNQRLDASIKNELKQLRLKLLSH
ncbi:MAG: ATP synthase F1 subunit delta [Muribaculaceae bacterium]|nr:ATP synthase F1 subunit delta [Muribaculaceae bacterium]